jgi:hypothetical protein
VADIDGYRVVTTEGKSVGRVAGESERALVVERGTWPWKAWRAIPKASTSVDPDERRVVIQVSKDIVMQSPKLRQGAPVDDDAVAAWWGLD